MYSSRFRVRFATVRTVFTVFAQYSRSIREVFARYSRVFAQYSRSIREVFAHIRAHSRAFTHSHTHSHSVSMSVLVSVAPSDSRLVEHSSHIPVLSHTVLTCASLSLGRMHMSLFLSVSATTPIHPQSFP